MLPAVLVGNAQKLKESQVPLETRAAFTKNYPNAKGTWDKEDANYEVNFKEKGNPVSMVIDIHGTIIEKETDIPVSDLPAPITEYVKKNYAGAKIHGAARIVKQSGEINYEAEVGRKDLVFDGAGKFIKETKD